MAGDSEHGGWDWVRRNWLLHLLAFALSMIWFLPGAVRGQGRDGLWVYFGFCGVWLLVAALNAARQPGWTRSLFGCLAIMVNAFTLPYSFYAYGLSVEGAALGGALYVILVFAVSPLEACLAGLCAGIAFALYLRLYLAQFGDGPLPATLGHMTLAYAGLAAVGFAWRLLVYRLHAALTAAPAPAPAAAPEAAGDAAAQAALEEENRLLKEQIAVHVLELNDLTGSEG